MNPNPPAKPTVACAHPGCGKAIEVGAKGQARHMATAHGIGEFFVCPFAGCDYENHYKWHFESHLVKKHFLTKEAAKAEAAATVPVVRNGK